MYRWTETEQLHHLVKRFDAQAAYHAELGESYAYPEFTYAAKVKLHGTNAGIQIDPEGSVTAQGRNRVLEESDTNNGFWNWVDQTRSYWADLDPDHPLTVYGEWCGPGIQRGTALSGLKRKMFCVFAVQRVVDGIAQLMTDPWGILEILDGPPADCYVLPYWGPTVEIDYSDRYRLREVAAQISELTLEVEACDPWVEETFEHRGIGEGLVWFPMVGAWHLRETTTSYVFKSKGEKHQVVKQKNPAQVDPQKAESATRFVDMVVTDARLAQALEEVGGVAEMRHTAAFMRWLSDDIRKECSDELNISGLAWKDVGKLISSRAVKWFKARAEAI